MASEVKVFDLSCNQDADMTTARIFLEQPTIYILQYLSSFVDKVLNARREIQNSQRVTTPWGLAQIDLIKILEQVESARDEIMSPSPGNGLNALFLRELIGRLSSIFQESKRADCPNEFLRKPCRDLDWVVEHAGLIGSNIVTASLELKRNSFSRVLGTRPEESAKFRFEQLIQHAYSWWHDALAIKTDHRKKQQRGSWSDACAKVKRETTCAIEQCNTFVFQAIIECDLDVTAQIEKVVLQACQNPPSGRTANLFQIIVNEIHNQARSLSNGFSADGLLQDDTHSVSQLRDYCEHVADSLRAVYELIFPQICSTPGTAKFKMRWDNSTGRLYCNGEIIREVKKNAVNLCAVFKRFQDLGWPESIDFPFPSLSSSSDLKDVIKSLNAKPMAHIKFHSKDGDKILFDQVSG